MIFSYKRIIIPSGEEINITATTTQAEPPLEVVHQSFTTEAIGNNLHNKCVGATSEGGRIAQEGFVGAKVGLEEQREKGDRAKLKGVPI